MKIVLIGYMGSGKSSVGKKLAGVLSLPFKDMDTEIEKNEGISVPKIFSEKGEVYFRKVENSTLKKLLQLPDSFVLATGGGTPCYGNSMETILKSKDTVSIYLKVSIPVLASRLFAERTHRPLLAHLLSEAELNDYIRKHLFERNHYYGQANNTIDCSTGTIDEIVGKIVLKLF